MTNVVQTSGNIPKSNLLDQARSRYIQILIIFNIVGESIGLVLLQNSTFDPAAGIARVLTLGLFMVVDISLLFFLRRREGINLAATVILLKIMGGVIAASTAQYWWLMITSTVALLAAATLAQRWLYILMNVLVFAQITYNILTNNLQSAIGATDAQPNLVLMLSLVILSVTTRYFTNTTQRAAEAAGRNTNLLRAAAETGQDLSKLLKLDEILSQSVEFIRERFGFYHVQIFLVDARGENAVLAASTGTVGQKLFQRQHTLAVGSRSVIGSVSSIGKSVIARDTDPVYYRNELLPNTRSELALPIFDGDKIIGVLDVQSRRYDVFDEEVTQALQALSNQLGTSIRNSRLFDEQEKNTRETKRLFLEAETNLREIQRLNQQLTRQGWSDYLGQRGQSSGVTIKENEMLAGGEWSESLVKASQTRQPVRQAHGEQSVMAVPVMLGSEVIGAIEVETGDRKADAEAMEIMQAVAQRLAISLDKARLFEESQEATSREQRINEIVARYQTVGNVDDLLRITLEELTQTLGAKRSAIRLGSLPAASMNGESHS